ncbi:MAG: M20/M25/M40 family metallo-hydrolase [Planctomycetes bacterium]|nr:M20/M25/M40 family metallo-hydrolase [Planctomycetota bacterium]
MNLAKVHEDMDRAFPRHLERVQEFLRIESVSGQATVLQRAARWLQAYVEELGGESELAGRPEAPIVFARFAAGKPKTLLAYGMYDVQPVAGQAWTSAPFAAEVRDLPGLGPCIMARGACNSKGPLVGFLNAVEAIIQADELPVNLLLTIEGEEEQGSPTIGAFYRQNRERLAADAGFEPFWADYGTDVDRPTISLGTKGILDLELVCAGGEWGGPVERPIHSSVGTLVASPTWRLIKALATLVDEDERVVIEGFYGDVAPPRPEDDEVLSRLAAGFDGAALAAWLGARRLKRPSLGGSLLREHFFAPCIHVEQIVEPSGSGGAIPAAARARLEIRLVPDMDPARTAQLVADHLRRRGYGDIEVVTTASYPCSRTDLAAPVVQAMIAAYKRHGCEPQIVPLMASASPYYLFSDVLRIPYVWGGLGKAGRSHAPDEYASVEGLRLFEKSLATFLYCFASACEAHRPGDVPHAARAPREDAAGVAR